MARAAILLALLLVVGGGLASCGSAISTESESANSNVLFADDFGENSTGDWHTEADDFGTTAVANHRMSIEVRAPNTMQYTTLREPSFSDFVLEVDATQLAGSLESTFGVLVRMQNPDEFYRFEITGDGRYMIERHNPDGSWTRFEDDWLESSALVTGLKASNRLKVVAQGPELSFYANGELLQEVSDDAYLTGRIGLDAGTFSEAGSNVVFDDLIVLRP